MRKVFVVLGVLVFLLVADIGLKAVAESQLKGRARSKLANVGSVSVDYHGLPGSSEGAPFLWHAFVSGKVPTATIDMREIVESPMSMSLLRADVDDLGVGRGAALGGGRSASGHGAVRLTAVLSPKNLSDALSTPVQLRRGYLHATVDGKVIDGPVTIKGRTLVVTDPDHPPITIPMPSTDWLSCTPTGVGVDKGGIVLGCSSDSLPPKVAPAIMSGTRR